MNNTLTSVPIGEITVTTNPDDVLVVYGIGSCVVICLYDPQAQVGGMLHALLPGKAWNGKTPSKATKFVDQGIPLLIDALTALGAKKNRLQTYIIGGAKMITAPGFNDQLNIGERNVMAAQMSLHAAGLEISGQATGGYAGRTVKFYINNGHITLKILGQEEQLLQLATIRS